MVFDSIQVLQRSFLLGLTCLGLNETIGFYLIGLGFAGIAGGSLSRDILFWFQWRPRGVIRLRRGVASELINNPGENSRLA